VILPNLLPLMSIREQIDGGGAVSGLGERIERKVDPADERPIRSIRSENPLTAPTDATRARLAVQTHSARIALHRPLNQIADPTERAAAELVHLC
jgi:hypothetical protein